MVVHHYGEWKIVDCGWLMVDGGAWNDKVSAVILNFHTCCHSEFPTCCHPEFISGSARLSVKRGTALVFSIFFAIIML
jgi:hypothetical protein